MAVYLKVKINNTLHHEHWCWQFPHSVKENKTEIGVLALDTCMSSVTVIPDYSPMSNLPGSVFKYSLDLIHFFFPKVNNGEMNPPILLDACLPRK